MDLTYTSEASVTPTRRTVAESSSPFVAPPTPCLKKIGWGTGVGVYHMDRSPYSGSARSPWALKKVMRAPRKQNFIGTRLKLEADILKKLNHPNIVGFRSFTQTKDGREVLAMEECEKSLGSILESRYENNRTPMDPNMILFIVHQVCKALKYIHEEHRIIHGDIKSYNILIKGNYDEIKLCDFGVSFPLNEEGVAPDYVGTEVWSAPETIDGPVTTKADIFSLGLTIYEMICLVPPHTMDNSFSEGLDDSMEVEDKNGTRPDLPADLGEAYSVVEKIFMWCTEGDYQKRPTAGDLVSFIEQTGKIA